MNELVKVSSGSSLSISKKLNRTYWGVNVLFQVQKSRRNLCKAKPNLSIFPNTNSRSQIDNFQFQLWPLSYLCFLQFSRRCTLDLLKWAWCSSESLTDFPKGLSPLIKRTLKWDLHRYHLSLYKFFSDKQFYHFLTDNTTQHRSPGECGSLLLFITLLRLHHNTTNVVVQNIQCSSLSLRSANKNRYFFAWPWSSPLKFAPIFLKQKNMSQMSRLRQDPLLRLF